MASYLSGFRNKKDNGLNQFFLFLQDSLPWLFPYHELWDFSVPYVA